MSLATTDPKELLPPEDMHEVAFRQISALREERDRLRVANSTMHEALDAIGEPGTGYWSAERMQEVAAAAIRGARLQYPGEQDPHTVPPAAPIL